MPAEPKSAFSFASLLGFGPKAEAPKDQTDGDIETYRSKAETDDRYCQQDGESDEDYCKRCQALDELDNEPSANAKPDPVAEAVQAERARCGRIIAHGIKTGLVEQAGVFAFDTDMSDFAAIAAMNASKIIGSSKATKTSLGQRMAGVKTPAINDGGAGGYYEPGSAQATALAIIEAGKRARGEI